MTDGDISSLLERARHARSPKQACWRLKIDGKAREVIQMAEAEGIQNFTHEGLSRVLAETGFPIGSKGLGDHYRNHKGRPCWTPTTS